MKRLFITAAVAAIAAGASAHAAEDTVKVTMNLISDKGVGKEIGTIGLSDSDNGLVLRLELAGELRPGPHGFHVHQNGDCAVAEKDGKMVAGLAAGGHYDPHSTGKHMGPGGQGHLGDLPVIHVDVDESGARPVRENKVAPHLKLADVLGRSLMIHESGDNYRDEPKPLGGGGARVACGVVPAS